MNRSLISRAALSILVALSAAATAQPTAHMLQNPAEHVVLLANSQKLPQLCSFRRIFPTSDPADRIPDFEIPPGRLLVITDVEWEALGLLLFDPKEIQPFDKGARVTFQLELAKLAIPFETLPIMQSRGLVADRAEPVAGSEQLTTGVVLAPATMFCARAEVLEVSFGGSQAVVQRHSAQLGRVILRGYLIDAS